MGAATKGMGQQNGTCRTATGEILEVSGWDFEPAQKLGGVVTNYTGGFEGQIHGAISGKGKVTVVVPNGATSAVMQMDPQGGNALDVTLQLYADLNQHHGFTDVVASLESSPVSIDLSSDKGIEITYNFKSNGPFKAIGAFAVIGPSVTGNSGSSGM